MRLDLRGGKREGAGRKPVLDKQLARAESLAKQLSLGIKVGLEKVAQAYPAVIDIAIQEALGVNAEGQKVKAPNLLMLKTLVELGIRLLAEDKDLTETPIARLIRGLKENVTLIQNNFYGRADASLPSTDVVGVDVGADSQGVGSDTGARVEGSVAE